jgi:hypothetical protein
MLLGWVPHSNKGSSGYGSVLVCFECGNSGPCITHWAANPNPRFGLFRFKLQLTSVGAFDVSACGVSQTEFCIKDVVVLAR